jgi:CubicO group peptidase (beta-lactamase class C family)
MGVANGCHRTPTAPDPPEAPSSDLDRFVIGQMQAGRIPGLSACVVRDGRVAWTRAYGWADIENRVATTPDTVFQVGSISKTILATAVMQAVEAGSLRLDDDVNAYLPFSTRNPRAASAPITARMLLAHTSSIKDNPSLLGSLNRVSIPLGTFLQDYLVPGRRYASDTYYESAPGTATNYSNVGASLAGYVVERVSGRSFEDYARLRILEPLGIHVSSWRPGPIQGQPNAVPHVDYEAVTPDEYPIVYPGGALRTTAPQLARFLLMFMEGGSLLEVKVVEPSSVTEMARVQFPEASGVQGLCWSYFENGRTLGHLGGLTGIGGVMVFRPAEGVGVVTLVNGDLNDPNGTYVGNIVVRLLDDVDLP